MFQKMAVFALVFGLAANGCMGGPKVGMTEISAVELKGELPEWTVSQETYLRATFVHTKTGAVVRASTVRLDGKHVVEKDDQLRVNPNEVCPGGAAEERTLGYEPIIDGDSFLVLCGVNPGGAAGSLMAEIHALSEVARRHLVRLEVR
jgi:hypothetical protein